VFGAFAASVLVALASWLVRTRRISPFGALGRTFRTASDPLIRPIENAPRAGRRQPGPRGMVARRGVGGRGCAFPHALELAGGDGVQRGGRVLRRPRAAIALAIDLVYSIIVVALWVRVLASWFGYFRSRGGSGRRTRSPTGSSSRYAACSRGRRFDWSPLAAWLALWLLKRVLLTIVVG